MLHIECTSVRKSHFFKKVKVMQNIKHSGFMRKTSFNSLSVVSYLIKTFFFFFTSCPINHLSERWMPLMETQVCVPQQWSKSSCSQLCAKRWRGLQPVWWIHTWVDRQTWGETNESWNWGLNEQIKPKDRRCGLSKWRLKWPKTKRIQLPIPLKQVYISLMNS